MNIIDCLNKGFTGQGSFKDGDEFTFERCIIRDLRRLRVRVNLGTEDGEILVIDADANRHGEDWCFRTETVCYEGSQYKGKLTIVIDEIDGAEGELYGLDLSGAWWDEHDNQHYPFSAYVDLIKR